MSNPDLSSSAVHELYSDHHGWLRGWLRKKLGCSDLAADIAHDTFVRILSARDVLAGLNEPRAYLTTTARRLLVDHVRRQRIEQAYLSELALVSQTMDSAPAPEAVLAAIQSLQELVCALGDLSDKAREAFLLHYLDGESQSEVAVRLGVSVRMVQKYLAQALLRCHLALDF